MISSLERPHYKRAAIEVRSCHKIHCRLANFYSCACLGTVEAAADVAIAGHHIDDGGEQGSLSL